MKYAILGAGLTGLTVARLLSNAGHKVVVYEKNRNEFGGMCFEKKDERDVLYSIYGPHIFHTNDEEVWQFVNKYCEMLKYKHTVKSITEEGLYNWPINYDVLYQIFGGYTKEMTYANWQKEVLKENNFDKNEPDNFETVAIRNIGTRLYNLFIKTYTTTQWGRDPKELPAELFGRIRIEQTNSRKFFNDKYVAMAKNGFNDLCANLLQGIKIIYKEIGHKDLEELKSKHDKIISTIPPWILLNEKPLYMIKINFVNFEDTRNVDLIDILEIMQSNDLSVLNLCNNKQYTRMTNYGILYKHLNIKNKYIVEEPSDSGIPLYPIRIKENVDKADNMILRLREQHDIISIGRLGLYKYINMDQAIRQGIDTFNLLEGEI